MPATEPKIVIEKCFAVPGEDHCIDGIHPATGRGVYSGETLDEVRRRYPAAEITPLAEHCKAKAARQQTPITLIETTEEKYWEMLEVLPPAIMLGGCFSVGEPCDHCAETGRPRFESYFADGNKYFVGSRPMTVKEFRAIVALKYAGAAQP